MQAFANNLYEKCASGILKLVQHEYLFFDEAVDVLGSRIWGACVSPASEIYLMDGDQQWHRLEKETAVPQNLVAVLNPVYEALVKTEWRYA